MACASPIAHSCCAAESCSRAVRRPGRSIPKTFPPFMGARSRWPSYAPPVEASTVSASCANRALSINLCAPGRNGLARRPLLSAPVSRGGGAMVARIRHAKKMSDSRPLPCGLRRYARQEDLGLSRAEFAVLQRLGSPHRIQAYLNAIPINHEIGGETVLCVREVLKQRRAHCIEGAFVAAAALWVHGEPPLLMHLDCHISDFPHVIAVFRRAGG